MLEKIIVALDLPNPKACMPWLKRLQGKVAGVKIGYGLFSLGGPGLLQMAKAHQLPVFLDLKFHDIPNTVENAAKAAAEIGVWMFTVHAQGGMEMLKAAKRGVERVTSSTESPKILAVTVLTSQETKINEVLERAKCAKEAGCHGVISSAKEVKEIRKKMGKDFLIVTPGIRFKENSKDDQKRVATPQEAIEYGADYLVMGRPFLDHPDPDQLLKALR